MTAPESTAELARQMIRLDALCARAEGVGDYAQVRQLLERRDEIRDQRSRLLRVQWQQQQRLLPVR